MIGMDHRSAQPVFFYLPFVRDLKNGGKTKFVFMWPQ